MTAGKIRHRAENGRQGRSADKPAFDPEFTEHNLQLWLVPNVFLPSIIVPIDKIIGRKILGLNVNAPVPIDLEERALQFGSIIKKEQ